MAEVTHEHIVTNGITMHVASCGPRDGKPVVLCHGFPELWYSWRHQLTALAGAGYRAMAPDLRGYGSSDSPKGDVAEYGSDRLTGDLCGLLDHYGYDQAAFVGHDWGAIVLWEMGKLHPERMSSLYNMSVPLMQAPSAPIALYDALFDDKFFYILYFQRVGVAESELEGDTRRFLRNMLYSASGEGMALGASLGPAPREGTGMLDILREAPVVLPSWLSEHDVDVYTRGFAQSGFFGPLSFYRNLDANWERGRAIAPATIVMPTGFLTGSLDPVKLMMPGAAELMATTLPDFRGATTIEGAGHWVQQERPDESNTALMGFLATLD
jgi:pimeloyl-ACP methyl ester carboxylesterase